MWFNFMVACPFKKQLTQYLLLLIDIAQRNHLTGEMNPKHFAEGAGGNLTGETVDVHLLALMVRTRYLSRSWRRREDPGRQTRVVKHHCVCFMSFTSSLCVS